MLALALVAVVWGMATPSNSRDWQPEVAVLPDAVIDGDRVTVHNIRNFDSRTETDFTPAYYDKTFDVRRLAGVDLVAVYWMGPAIAHLFVTLNFGEDHLAISVVTEEPRDGCVGLRLVLPRFADPLAEHPAHLDVLAQRSQWLQSPGAGAEGAPGSR